MPPSKYSHEISALSPRWVAFFSNLTLAYPLLLLASLYSQWLLSWAVLGYPPQPSFDDPKSIVGVSWMHDFTGLIFLSCIPMLFGGLVFNTLYIFNRRLKGIRILRRILLFLMSWLVMFLLLQSDPGAILKWWLD